MKRILLDRNSWLQAEKGSSADERRILNVSQSVLSTLKYSDHFDFPLTLDEIHLRLVGARSFRPLLSKTISSLLSTHQIEKHGIYYHLPNRQSLVPRRLKFAKLSIPLLTRAQTLATRLSRYPFILAIFLTGSLAVNNTNGDGDIDLMIITKPKRLWTTRFFLTLYTTIFGLRRTPHSRNNSGKLCLNLYLTPTAFCLPASRQSLYTAYELIQAVPLYDPHNTRSALLSANSWLKKYLPNHPLPKGREFRTLQNASVRNFWNYLEYIFFQLQYLYMKRRITREHITPNSAFFHPHDPSPKV